MRDQRTSMPRVLILPAVTLPAIILAVVLLKAVLPDPILSPILSAQADSSPRSDHAESYIADFFRATVETAVASQSDEVATKSIKVLLLRAIPLDDTARFMLGRAWPTDNQQAGRRFQEAFQDFVAETVAKGLRANPTLNLEVKGSRTRSDGSTLVLSTLALPSGPTLPVDWRVAENPSSGTFQIIDINVAGFDAATLLRSMTEATLAKTDIDGVIPQWRAALAKRAASQAESATVTSP
jgi:ABC-type transporter MlaC component